MAERLRRAGLTLGPFLLVCLQLQIPTVSLGPVIAVVSEDAGLTLAQAGALTSIPVFCFALLTPVAARAIGVLGINRAFVLASVGIALGLVLRSTGPIPALFAGSVLLGSCIALINIAIPTLITRRYRHRALLMSGLQTSATNIGSAVSALVSAPLVALLGWQLGLGIWSAVSLLAALVWWWRFGIARDGATPDASAPPVPDVAEAVAESAGLVRPAPAVPDGQERPRRPGWKVPLAWVLGLTFVFHGICYFAVSTWLPLLLQERSGLSENAAGACVAVFMALGIVGPLMLPLMLRLPRVELWMLMTLTTSGWLLCILLLAAAPGLWPAAVLIGGLAQGATFTVIVTFGVHVAADEVQSRGIQATLQTIGFGGSAVGPILIGAVLDATGSWEAPLGVLVGIAVALVAVGGVASRMLLGHDRTLVHQHP